MGKDDQSSFGSFKDLLRAKQGDDGDAKEKAEETDRGWTIEREGAAVEVTGEEGTSASSGALERVRLRPDGFGPMDSGPPMYADVDSDEMQLLASFRVRTLFPEDVLREMRELPSDPDPKDYAGRRDLRGETIFTIDGADAKDYDDAISIDELEDGKVRVGVHIADVAHYVRPGTALDAEAVARGTSVYLADQVVPMLPEELSNGLCSLVPGRDRFAFSVFMVFDDKGKRLEAEVAKTVIKSVQRNTYRVVQKLLDGEDDEETREIAFLEKPLKLFQAWTRKQQQLRDAKGSLRIQSTERRFVFDDKYEVEAVVNAPRYFSQTLIEETALAANQAVGDLFRKRGLPTIYRVHPEKDPEEIDAIANMLEEHGLRVPRKERLTGRDVGRLIRAARGRPNAEALIGRIMGLVERAYYEVHDHEDVGRHFGLAREAYLHFTSPIRRYPDLTVHRWLWNVESGDPNAEKELATEDLISDLNDVARHSSLQADLAEMAEQAIGDLKTCQYMEPHIGERLEAKVQRVNRGGIEVLLTDYNVSGFLPARSMGERPQVKGSTLTVRAGKRMLSFTEGYPVKICIKDVDFIRLQILLELA